MTECSDSDTDIFKIAMIAAVIVLGALLIIENIIVCWMCCCNKKNVFTRRRSFSEDSAKLEEFIKAVE